MILDHGAKKHKKYMPVISASGTYQNTFTFQLIAFIFLCLAFSLKISPDKHKILLRNPRYAHCFCKLYFIYKFYKTSFYMSIIILLILYRNSSFSAFRLYKHHKRIAVKRPVKFYSIIPLSILAVRIRRTLSSIRSSCNSPLSRAALIPSAAPVRSSGIRIRSTPASNARTAASPELY